VNRLQRLHDAGVSIWLDTLSRELLETGAFAELVHDFAVTGATSNPTIFAKAITGSDRYDDQLRRLASDAGDDLQELFFAVALDDVRRAAQVLLPVHRRSRGGDGYVSFECTPDVADDADATIAQALDLWQRLDLPNVLIKVPATQAGVSAIEALTAHGVNINVTLLFSVERYEEVIEAYLRGLEHRVAAGKPVDGITSVASFFVSRIDTKADGILAPDSPARGQVAIANALRRRALGPPATAWREPAASPMGEYRDEGSKLFRRALRRKLDRSRRDQHDAREDPARVRRARRCRGAARLRAQRGGRGELPSRCRRRGPRGDHA
jgi:transaldolase